MLNTAHLSAFFNALSDTNTTIKNLFTYFAVKIIIVSFINCPSLNFFHYIDKKNPAETPYKTPTGGQSHTSAVVGTAPEIIALVFLQ